MSPHPAILLLLVVAASLMGCGNSSDRDEITKLSKQMYADAKDKDWEGVCDALSTKAKAEIAVAAAFFGGGGCPAVVAAAFALDDDPGNLGEIDPDKVKVTNIKISEDRATAQVTPSDDEDPTTRYVREDGEWKVDADPDDDGSSSTTTGDSSDDRTATATPAPALRVAEQGFSRQEGGSVSYGIVIRNPGPQDAVGVEVQINLLAADGGVAATETARLEGIPAGKTVNVGGETDAEGERVGRLEITVKAGSGEDAGAVTLPKVSRIRISRDDFGLSVRAQVTNTLEEPLSSISDVFAVLRDRKGKVVGGLSGYPDNDIAPASRAAVKLGGFGDVSGATRAEVTADAETSG